MHSQGFLMISTTCPVCRGEGRVVRKPCDSCDGTGLDHQEETLEVNDPGGRRGRFDAASGRARRGGAAGRPRRATSTSSCASQGDERFERDGADLHAEVAVSFPQLALGDTVEVPTLDGEGELDIPPGTQPGETVALRGRGMPRLDGRGRGDIVAHVKLVVPSSMSPRKRRTCARTPRRAASASAPRSGGFFRRKKKK